MKEHALEEYSCLTVMSQFLVIQKRLMNEARLCEDRRTMQACDEMALGGRPVGLILFSNARDISSLQM